MSQVRKPNQRYKNLGTEVEVSNKVLFLSRRKEKTFLLQGVKFPVQYTHMIFSANNRNRSMVLMHGSTPVLTGTYDPQSHGFKKVRELNDAKHLPIGVSQSGGSVDLERLNYWLFWRGIPNYRVDLERLVTRLNLNSEKDLLEEDHALSVSDNYWLCPEDKKLSYAKLNYFGREFDQNGFARAMFRANRYVPEETAKKTPNNTLCGYHRKAWLRRNDTLLLYKGSTGFAQQECINEWIASLIAERLGMDSVPYETDVYENQLVSVCPNFLNPGLDLVPAESVIHAMEHNDSEFWLPGYIRILEEHGISDARQYMEEMFLLDYIMMNTDRHVQNHGILVDVNTNRWIAVAPIFDTGTGLGCFVKTQDLSSYETEKTCRLFNRRHFSHEELLDLCTGLKNYDLTALDGIVEEFARKLAQYQSMTGLTDERGMELCRLLQRRINRVKSAQMRI